MQHLIWCPLSGLHARATTQTATRHALTSALPRQQRNGPRSRARVFETQCLSDSCNSFTFGHTSTVGSSHAPGAHVAQVRSHVAIPPTLLATGQTPQMVAVPGPSAGAPAGATSWAHPGRPRWCCVDKVKLVPKVAQYEASSSRGRRWQHGCENMF
jgi:hypothetical protein